MKHDITIPISTGNLEGILGLPEKPVGLIIFSHGSGSGRLSSRNQYVADVLETHGFATALFDLLTPEEDRDYANRFDIPTLTERLSAITDALALREDVGALPIGYFGASTGAASALRAAARRGEQIRAVVSRGGRPDLVPKDELRQVAAPTLLIVGSNDTDVISFNEAAYEHLTCLKELALIPGATHLFEEPGTLELAARHASEWFSAHVPHNILRVF